MPLLTNSASLFLGGSRVPADPVPVAGSELLANGDFEAGDTGWTKGAGWSIDAGVASAAAAAVGANLTQSGPIANHLFYQTQFTIANYVAGVIQLNCGGAGGGALRFAAGTYLQTIRSGAGNTIFYVGTYDTLTTDIDNISCKLLALSSLLSTRAYASADCDLSAAVTRTAGTQAGLVARLDNPANPQNFILCYLDGAGNVKVDKCVGGTYTAVITGAVTYVAGQVLRLACSGNDVSVYYNGTQVGSTTAVADAGIVSNTRHGLFSTYAANTFAGYVAA
jgi:hypothetical protein